ncbi:glycosyltransferase [Ilumatobacter sp.]|uniref:glycosyltransferase n=1 Tax=Ilumatobacter sp. TaxID=1967498 RepID=UPI003B51EB72
MPATSPSPRRGTVAIVVLTYDPAPSMLEAAVAAAIRCSPPDTTLLVVDNGRRARPLLAAAAIPGHPHGSLLDAVELIETGANGGFGAGMNRGIDAAAAAGAEAIALLNDDVVVTDGWLPPLLAELERDRGVGAAQPVLVHAGSDRVNSAGVRIDATGQGHDVSRDRPVDDLGTDPTEIDAFTGGAVLLRRSFLDDVGRFDERFFLYYEDVELARRGRSRGWRYLVVPASRVEHRGGATTRSLGAEVRRLQERNRLWSSAIGGSPGEVARAVALSVRRLRHPPRRVHARALVAGVAGMPTRLVERLLRRPPRLARSVARRARAVGDRRRARRVVGTPGVNVVGYHHISSGLGQNARELSAALRAAGIDVVDIDNDLSTSPRRRPADPVPDAVHDTTIAIVTAFEFAHFVERFPRLTGPGRRMIGYWVWELEHVPAAHLEALALVTELWSPTTFVRDAYREATAGRVPVHLAPLPMEAPDVDDDEVRAWRAGWGSDVVFLVSFDHLSIVERKNPLGAIGAFRRAFGATEGERGDGTGPAVRLVVKSINGEQRPEGARAVVEACGDDDRIEILDEHLDDRRHHALLAAADCLVSLHRSEGYGLHPALAMRLGTAVVSTRYSGVLDFLDDSCAALVDADRVAVTGGQGIYPEEATWADPDLDQAALHLRRLATDADHRAGLVERARRRVASQPSPASFGEGYAALLRTDPSTPATGEPFFDGLDAARGTRRPWWLVRALRRHRASPWPDSARDRRRATRLDEAGALPSGPGGVAAR